MSARETSVIIPVFNGARHLAEALRSVFEQTTPPGEILVVDDGSTDSSTSIAESFGPPVCVLRQANAGANAARNHGLRNARGSFIAFLDADDIWLPDKLRSQHEQFAAHPGLLVVFGAVEQFISPELSAEERTELKPPAESLKAPHVGTMLARREVFERVGPFREGVVIGDFLDWYVRATEAAIPMKLDAAPMLRRRIHTTNTTRRHRTERHGYLHVLKQSLDRRRQAASERPRDEQAC